MPHRVDPVAPVEPASPVGERPVGDVDAADDESATGAFADLLADLQRDADEADRADGRDHDLTGASGRDGVDGGRARVGRRAPRRRRAQRQVPVDPLDVLGDGGALSAWLGELDDQVLVDHLTPVLELGF